MKTTITIITTSMVKVVYKTLSSSTFSLFSTYYFSFPSAFNSGKALPYKLQTVDTKRAKKPSGK